MIKERVQSEKALVINTASTKLSAVFVIAFGAFIVFGTGFAQPNVLHNAAHDARHSFGFPCH